MIAHAYKQYVNQIFDLTSESKVTATLYLKPALLGIIFWPRVFIFSTLIAFLDNNKRLKLI